MPAHTFNLFDSVAGYYVSYVEVFPEAKHIIDTPIQAILAKNVELRLLPYNFDNRLMVDIVYNKLKQQKRCFNL
jgi:hypothetical protein